MKILVLCTDAFGGRGGIAKFNRDLLSALCACPEVEKVVALPRLQAEPPGPLPDKLRYDTSGVGGKLRYLLAAIRIARRMVLETDTSPNPLPGRGGEGKAIGGGPAPSRPSTLNHVPSTSFDLILCGHINLLPAAFLARAMMRRKAAGRSGEAPRPLTPSLSPSDGERVSERRERGIAQPSTLNSHLSTPLVLIIHGIDAWQPTRSALVNRLVRKIDAFIAVSDFTRKRFLAWAFPEMVASGVTPDVEPGVSPGGKTVPASARMLEVQEAPGGRMPAATGPRSFILPNCVDLARFTPGPKNPALLDRYGLHDRTVLLTVARLSADERYKGIDEVLEVLPELARQIPNLGYLIVGDGTDRPRLMQKALSLGLRVTDSASALPSPPRSGRGRGEVSSFDSFPPAGDLPPAAPRQVAANQSADKSAHSKESSTLNAQPSTHVFFAGHIPESEKVDHYRLADAFAMPGRGEGFGIVYLEALACGVPIVASKADASQEIVARIGESTAVDPNNREELAQALLQTMKNGKRGVPAKLAEFSWENFCRSCHEILTGTTGTEGKHCVKAQAESKVVT